MIVSLEIDLSAFQKLYIRFSHLKFLWNYCTINVVVKYFVAWVGFSFELFGDAKQILPAG